jgi:hypothetical protein
MSVPAWLLDIFAAVMLLVAAVSAARLAISRRLRDPDADIDLSHLLMGLAMASTLVASLSTLPSAAWEVIFGALTLWFAHRVTRGYRAGRSLRALISEHHAPHLLHSAAMLYMFLALRPPASHAPPSAMPAMSAAGLRLPTLALAFAFLLCAYVVADLDRVPAPRALTHLRLVTPAPALALAGAPTSASLSAPALTGAPALNSAPALTSPAASSTSKPPATPSAPAGPRLSAFLSPGVARGCRIAMGVTMAFMLIIMI